MILLPALSVGRVVLVAMADRSADLVYSGQWGSNTIARRIARRASKGSRPGGQRFHPPWPLPRVIGTGDLPSGYDMDRIPKRPTGSASRTHLCGTPCRSERRSGFRFAGQVPVGFAESGKAERIRRLPPGVGEGARVPNSAVAWPVNIRLWLCASLPFYRFLRYLTYQLGS